MPMVAVCDILGFSNLVQKNDLSFVVNDNLSYLRQALHHSIHHGDFPDDIPTLRDLLLHENVGFAWFSDTLFFYGRDESDEANRRIIETVGWLMFETMMLPQLRIRAGISYGAIHVDTENSIYVGPAIIDAHRLEKIQLWSGGALTESACERISSDYHWVVSYDIPILTSNNSIETINTLAINWTFGIHSRGAFEIPWSRDSNEPTQEYIDNHPDIVEKWRNTRQFHRDVCRYCS